MAPVHRKRAASVVSGASRHRQAGRGKTPYKIVFEEVTQKKKLLTYLTADVNPPRGYTFIPAGDSQLNKRCRKYSKDFGITVYIVSPGARSAMELSREVHRIGHHFSTFVVENACKSLGVTLTTTGRVAQSQFAFLQDDVLKDKMIKRQGGLKKRKSKVQRGPSGFDSSLPQALIDTQAREAIKDLFPKIPERDVHEVISRAFDKSKGLVGTAEGFSLVRRATLAVVAHIRHMYTNYDELLQSGTLWADARRGVEQFTLDKLISWRGEEDDDDDDGDDDDMTAMLREVIVISDDEKHLPVSGDRPRFHHADYTANHESQDGVQNVDLIEIEDSDDSGDEDYGTYTRTIENNPDYGAQYDTARKTRQDERVYARWNEALIRHKEDSNRAQLGERNAVDKQDVRPPFPGPTQGLRPIPGLDGYNQSLVGSGKESNQKAATFPPPPPVREAPMRPSNKENQHGLVNPDTVTSFQTKISPSNMIERLYDPDRATNPPTTTSRPNAMQSPDLRQTLRPASLHESVLPSVEIETTEALSANERRVSNVHPIGAGQPRLSGRLGLERYPTDRDANFSGQQQIRPAEGYRTVLIPLDQISDHEVAQVEPHDLRQNISRDRPPPMQTFQAERFHDVPRQILLPQHETGQLASRDVEGVWGSQENSNSFQHQEHSQVHDSDPYSVSFPAATPFNMQRQRLVRLSNASESHKQTMYEPRLDRLERHMQTNDSNGVLAEGPQVSLGYDPMHNQGSTVSNARRNAGRLLDPYPPANYSNPMMTVSPNGGREVDTFEQSNRLVRLGDHQEQRREHSRHTQQPSQAAATEGPSLPRQIKLSQRNPFENGRVSHPYLAEDNTITRSFARPSAAVLYDQQVPSSHPAQGYQSRRPFYRANEVITLD